MRDRRPRVAIFRPADERLDRSVDRLAQLGFEAVPDPMLEIVPSGKLPRPDAEILILTSRTAANVLRDAEWAQPDIPLYAIGGPTASALSEAGYRVADTPETYTSAGVVEYLQDDVDGVRVEVARSDHGSAVLIDGLIDAGAYVHETVLYRLQKPADAGTSIEQLIDGHIDAMLFTSTLTVEHFLDAATERNVRDDVIEGVRRCVVGAIGPPTRRTLEAHELEVDVVPGEVTFDALAEALADDERVWHRS